jgi:hypothetical protein
MERRPNKEYLASHLGWCLDIVRVLTCNDRQGRSLRKLGFLPFCLLFRTRLDGLPLISPPFQGAYTIQFMMSYTVLEQLSIDVPSKNLSDTARTKNARPMRK